MSASFAPLSVSANAAGWGPTKPAVVFKDVPFIPFSKSDKLGKVADWTGNQNYRHGYRQNFGANAAGKFTYMHEDTEDSFHVVDSRPVQKTKFVSNRQRWINQNNSRFRREERWNRENPTANKGGRNQVTRTRRDKYNSSRYNDWNKQQRVRESHIEVLPDWEVKSALPFSELQKLKSGPVEAETLSECGSLMFYDKSYDRTTTKLDRKLVPAQGSISRPSAKDDPLLTSMASEDAGDVFVTDHTLAKLMVATRSIYPFDVEATVKDGKIFFDKRDNSADLLTVGETAAEPPSDEKDAGVNGFASLAEEASRVNQNFLQQVLQKGDKASKPHTIGGDVPFAEDDGVAPTAYRYRRFETEGGLRVVCRCQVDAAMTGKDGEAQTIAVKALHEWDAKLGVNWRKNLDSQRGAVLATEIRNNSNKLAQWGIKALLSEIDQIKIGYVSRMTVKDSKRHTILGTQFYQPGDFASQMALSMSNAWGIVDKLVTVLEEAGDGKYLILRDPNKALLNVYRPTGPVTAK